MDTARYHVGGCGHMLIGGGPDDSVANGMLQLHSKGCCNRAPPIIPYAVESNCVCNTPCACFILICARESGESNWDNGISIMMFQGNGFPWNLCHVYHGLETQILKVHSCIVARLN